jgi:hypothetical protein
MTTPTPYYDPNIPLINMPFADWQVNFLANFQRLGIAFSINHVALDATSNAGNHTYVDFVARDKIPEISISDFGIFSSFDTSKIPQLFMSFQNNQSFQYTAYQIFPVDPPIANQTTYFTILPGSLIAIFGKVSCAGKTFFSLNLSPPLIKDGGLISMCFTPVDNTGLTPTVIPAAWEGKYLQIQLSSNVPGTGSNPLSDYYYLIIGNI